MPDLTNQDVHEIAMEIQAVREELKAKGLDELERKLFEAECRLGRSLPPVTLTLMV